MSILSRLSILSSAAILATAAVHAVPAPTHSIDAAALARKSVESHLSVSNSRMSAINGINAMLEGRKTMQKAEAIEIPDPLSIGPVYTYGDIDGPNNELWYYTLDLENNEIKHEYFTEYILKSWRISVYDTDHNLVGTVYDEMDYASDEVRVPMCSILPSLTRNFFNDDDKLEIVVGLAINTAVPGIMRYRSQVYQLDGETDADGTSKVVCQLNDLVCDVLDATVPGGPENIFMSTMSELFPDFFPEDGTPGVWQYLTSSRIHLEVFGKASGANAPRKLLSYDICHQNIPGNQEDSPFIISVADGGKGYVIFSQYNETLFEPYYSMQEDIVQRSQNALKIQVYELTDKASEVQTTLINFTKDTDEKVIGSFYSIGDLRYRNDVRFEGGKASFTVTKGNKVVGNDESLLSSYYNYDSNGNYLNTIFENSQSKLEVSDLEGFEPQCMFVTMPNGEYRFNFADIISGKTVASFSQYLTIDGSDPDALLANMDRVAEGDSYKYVIEMRYPTEEDDISFMRIAWLNSDGTFDHFEEVNMGEGVLYAQSFIDSKTLNPATFLSDNHREYLLLIKRGLGGYVTSEDLLIGQERSKEYPDGRDVLLLTSGEKGAIRNIIPYTMSGIPTLAVAYVNGSDSFTIDYYSLPFDGGQSGIGSITAQPEGIADITFDGNTVSAPGFAICLYSLSGMKIASADGALDLSTFPSGAYIATAGRSAVKIIKK